MQSPQMLYALARQHDRITPPRTVVDRATSNEAPPARPAQKTEQRAAWFWQLLFRRRETAAS